MRFLRYHSQSQLNPNSADTMTSSIGDSRRESMSTKTAIIFSAGSGTSITTNTSISSHGNSQAIFRLFSEQTIFLKILLDTILLGFGMTGEMIYSVAGLLGLTGDPNWQQLTIILLLVNSDNNLTTFNTFHIVPRCTLPG